MNDKVDLILRKEVSRKEFLQHIVAALLAVVGITGMLKALSGSMDRPPERFNAGYGGNPYGGKKR